MVKAQQTYLETEQALSYTSGVLNALPLGKLPKNISQQAQELIKAVSSYDLEPLRKAVPLKTLKGKTLTPTQVTKIVQEATGYLWKAQTKTFAKWVTDYCDEDSAETGWEVEGPDEIEIGYKTSPAGVKVIELTRNTNNRSELFLIIIFLLPGHCYIHTIANDRASSGGDFCSNKDLAKNIRRNA